jgi:hypothetical protein
MKSPQWIVALAWAAAGCAGPCVTPEARAPFASGTSIYHELGSDKGHSAGTQDAGKYETALRAFLQRLASAR